MSAPDAGVVIPDAGVSPRFAALLAEADGGQVTILAREQRYLPGTEPHSPSTLGKAWKDPENARVTVGRAGIGHLFFPSARLGPKGIVRVSLLGEYLNLADFPVRSAQDIRSAVTFAASFQPFSWGEIFVSYGASANTNNRTAPNLVQTLGDLTLGVKAAYQLLPGFHAAVDLRFLTFSGVGNQGVDRFAVGFKPALLGTYDFRRLTPFLPVLLTAGFGLTLDSTGGLVTNRLNASEEFALQVNRYHRFDFGFAVEVPLPIVSPFVEYGFALPLGASSLIGPDGAAVAATAAMHQTLGLGLKATVVKDLTLLAGFDIGLASSVGLGVPATPPWNFCFGASFAIDPFQRGEITFVDTLRERKGPAAPFLEGVVTDADTKTPVAGAVIAIAGVKPSATNTAGEYRTLDLEGDRVRVSASRDGYTPVEKEVALRAGAPTRIDLELVADKRASFLVTTTAGKKPVKASVTFAGGGQETKVVDTDENATEPLSTELPAGQYVITATADGYLSQTRDVQVTPGASLPISFELVAAPKKSLVVFKGDKIDVLQQVHFASGKATILADSYNLLQQVADAVIKNNVKRLKVEGHTDNRGDKAVNQALSEARASAVADFLVSQGFEKQRVESVGYGDSKPIAPNLTARGRELNRRVEFIVTER